MERSPRLLLRDLHDLAQALEHRRRPLGVLGEQGPAQSVARARKLAASYQPLVRDRVVPAFELIATVADSAGWSPPANT